jgi:hypothetical protein
LMMQIYSHADEVSVKWGFRGCASLSHDQA